MGRRPEPPQPPVDLPPGLRHATFRARQIYGCKCLPCQTFRRQYAKDRYWLNKPAPPKITHGTLHSYNRKGCRCEECRKARREYDRGRERIRHRYTPRPRPPRPVRRRRDRAGDWYICVEDGRRYDWHDYLAGQCLRCDAHQETEEHWERKWKESKS